jgi:hypothetical protein
VRADSNVEYDCITLSIGERYTKHSGRGMHKSMTFSKFYIDIVVFQNIHKLKEQQQERNFRDFVRFIVTYQVFA